jgi:hypothetical protein
MNSLFLAWQDVGPTRAWFTIGRLDADTTTNRFVFGYTQGAKRAAEMAGLSPLESFPDFSRSYQSKELFPLFRNRVLSPSREEFKSYLEQLDLKPDANNEIAILSVTEGKRRTDNLQVFPKIERQHDGFFSIRFFVHGSRYTPTDAQASLLKLKPNDQLRVALELNNPATRDALQLQTDDYHVIGWAPRYLIEDLKKAIGESQDAVQGRVVRVNPPPAPANQRVLVELTGKFPADHVPMSSTDFQLIADTGALV